MPRFLAILFRPQATWAEIRSSEYPWTRPLLGHALPLTLLPALAWPVGRATTGLAGPEESIGYGFATTLVLTLACVLLFALGLYLLATFFEAQRNWARAVAVACYAATPVLLCGALLVMPLLIVASVGGLLYSIGICSIGVERLLDCKSEDVPGYLASAAIFMGAASMALGALCSAIGLI